MYFVFRREKNARVRAPLFFWRGNEEKKNKMLAAAIKHGAAGALVGAAIGLAKTMRTPAAAATDDEGRVARLMHGVRAIAPDRETSLAVESILQELDAMAEAAEGGRAEPTMTKTAYELKSKLEQALRPCGEEAEKEPVAFATEKVGIVEFYVEELLLNPAVVETTT